jgi:hypothetical protein
MALRSQLLAVAITLLVASQRAEGFPPYRSTDAATAAPWVIEGRLGLVRMTQRAGERTYSVPLMRLNLGLPANLELVSELEYVPEDGRLGEAAVGAKWIPFVSVVNVGVEILGLLPISSDGGAGIEATLVATWRRERFRAHVNAAGFHDARPDPEESGWKGGAIGEIALGPIRPGVEIFAKQVIDEDVQGLVGVGTIVKLGPIDVRLGGHVGVTEAAPDFVGSVWVSGALPL